jgi:hypothetical protein
MDISPPLIVIAEPLVSTIANSENYLASGRTYDNAGVASVLYQLNGGGWGPASSTNQWTNWTATLDLTPGTNYFSSYAVDTSGNQSAISTVKFVYNTAPATLFGLKGSVVPDGGSAYDMAFGAGTFSQESADPANGNGAGSYTYAKLSPSAGLLKASFTTPPKATNDLINAIRAWSLKFSAPGVARYTNLDTASSGSIQFTSTPTLASAALFNQTVVYVDDLGESGSTRFVGNQSVKSDLFVHTTNSPQTYTYYPYSPLGAVLKQTGTNGVAYSVLTFYGTNHGAAYLEEYGAAGSFNGTNHGVFALVSQRLGGNAPTNLTGHSALVNLPGDSFKLSFGPGNFTQSSPTDDSIIQGLGTYIYARAGTNIGSLNLNFSTPPETSAALFLFLAPNFAVFTNTDSTAGSAVFK